MCLINITPSEDLWYQLVDLPNETWLPVIYCPNHYMCSNYGRIKTIPRNGVKAGGRILKPCIKKDGYYAVVLQVNGKHLYKRVNRIIAETFNPINNCTNYVVDHINGDKLNNSVTNLQWLTNKDNINKYIATEYDGRYKGRGLIQPLPVTVYINKNNHLVKLGSYESLCECSTVLFGTPNKRGGISKAIKRNRPYHGYLFKSEVM